MSGRPSRDPGIASRGAVRRAVTVLAVVLLVAGGVWYGYAPPRSQTAYLHRAEQTAESLRSQARVAALWIRAVEEGRVTRQATTAALADTETDARTTGSQFAGWDPPAGTDEVRAGLTSSADELVSVLAAARIDAHRGRWSRLPETADQLDLLADRLAGQLDALRERR